MYGASGKIDPNFLGKLTIRVTLFRKSMALTSSAILLSCFTALYSQTSSSKFFEDAGKKTSSKNLLLSLHIN
jgi:hypothetical protein